MTVKTWPLYDGHDSLPREQQVDGVVRALLGGDVSADMRAVLLSGDHPMLEQAKAQAVVSADSSAIVPMMSSPPPAVMPTSRAQSSTGAGTTVAIDRTTRLARGMGPGVRFNGSGAPQGLSQIIGLAIGSPEFQRR